MSVRRIFRRIACEQRGFTVTELIVTMAILITVLGALTALFVAGSNAELQMNKRFQAQQNARVALDRLRREIHCASGVAAPAPPTPPGAAASVTLTLPAVCPGGGGTVTWCTQTVATSRYGLYRNVGSSCAGGLLVVDYLTSANIFGFIAQSTTSLAKLHVELPVDITTTDANPAYRLVDDIVLRNSSRA